MKWAGVEKSSFCGVPIIGNGRQRVERVCISGNAESVIQMYANARDNKGIQVVTLPMLRFLEW